MPVKKLGGDEPLPKPDVARERQGTALGVAPPAAPVVPRGDPYAPQPSPVVTPITAAVCSKCGLELPADAKFCGDCGSDAARAAVLTTAPATGSPAPVIALSVTLSAPPATVSSPVPAVPASSPATSITTAKPSGVTTQKLPVAKSGKGRRTLMGELETLRLIQSMNDKAELTNLGKAVGIVLLALLVFGTLGFIAWAIHDGRSRRRLPAPVSNTPISISVPLLDAGPTD